MDFGGPADSISSSPGQHEVMDDEDSVMERMEEASPAVDDASFARGICRIANTSRQPVRERYVEPEYPRLPSEGNLEWQYTMRRTMQEIIPGLYLGPYASATRSKLEEMKAAGLTHIVCVRQNLEKNLVRPNHPDHFRYLVVEIADTATENIIPHFKGVNAFLEECLAGGGKALVHGNAGISRSAALVIAYIMSRFGVTLKESFIFVQSKRFCCNPNEGFMAQLREYEPIYRALHTVPLPLPGQCDNRKSKKRELERDDADSTTPNLVASGSVMDTTAAPAHQVHRQYGTNANRQLLISSSESSVSSTSESLPHSVSSFSHPQPYPHPSSASSQSSDTAMSQ